MRNKAIILFTGLVIIIAFATCTSEEELVKTSYEKNFVYMLCDLTTSIDTPKTIINKVVANVEKVFAVIPPNTTYTLNPIGRAPDQSICEGETDTVSFTKTMIRKNKEQYDNCTKNIFQAYKTRHDNATCITDALQAACGTLKALDQKKAYDKVTLVIISDMLEACTINGIQLNLESVKTDTLTANKVINEWPSSRQYFVGLDDVEIYVVFNTSKLVSYSYLSDFWRRLFKQAGYNKDVHFVTDFRKEYLN